MTVETTTKTLTDTDLKLAIWESVEKWEQKFSEVWGIEVGAKVLFNLRGRSTAGTACSHNDELDFNLGCARVNLEHFLVTTVPHEMAHLATVEIFGWNRGKGHGSYWKHVMRSIGVSPDRTNSGYKNVPRARKVKRYIYISSCGCDFELTTHKHKIVQGQKQKGVYYTCTKHGNKIMADDYLEMRTLA